MKDKAIIILNFLKSFFNWKVLLRASILFIVFIFLGYMTVFVFKINVDKNKYTQVSFWILTMDIPFIAWYAFNKKHTREMKKTLFFTYNFLFVFILSWFDIFSEKDYSLLVFFIAFNLALEQLINYEYFDKLKNIKK